MTRPEEWNSEPSVITRPAPVASVRAAALTSPEGTLGRPIRERGARRLGALLLCALSSSVVNCQTQELRLFDPLGAASPDAATAPPRDVVPRTTVDQDAGSARPPTDEHDAAATPAPNLQPPCETTSATCRNCVAGHSCTAPDVCHPSSGNCVSACPGGDRDCSMASARLCNPTYGVCVVCLSDADCSGSTPACNSAAGVCVECLTDQHCAIGGNPGLPHCDVAAQSCRQCVVDADCGADLVCEPSEGHCDDSGGSGSAGSGSGDG